MTPSVAASHRTEIRSTFSTLFADIALDAAERDATVTLPHDHIATLKKAGLGAVRLPRSVGGAEVGLLDLFDLVRELGAADPSVAHAFRNHFVFVEQTLRAPERSHRRQWLPAVARGETIGGSFSESKASKAGIAEFETVLRRHGSHYLLTGVKIYSTGNVYADILVVKAVDETGAQVTVAVPSTRRGIDRTDDWDGIGQRLTASGTTRYNDVVVYEDEIVPEIEFADESKSYSATFPQLYLSTVIAGIVTNVLTDARRLVRERARNYYHGSADVPRHEEVVQQTMGSISTNSFAITSAVRSAALELELAWQTEIGPARDQALLSAALDAAKTKIFVDELAARTSWLIFELGGGSTPSRSKNLDRHWRNIRTLSSHNPGSYKLRYIGDYEINDVEPPKGSFF